MPVSDPAPSPHSAIEAQGKVPGWGALLASRDIGRITVLSFGVWLHAADELMVSTITPAMIGDIGGTAFVAWLIALYEIGSIVAGALAAFAVLRLGLRTALACAGLIYLAGCLIDAVAPDMAVCRHAKPGRRVAILSNDTR